MSEHVAQQLIGRIWTRMADGMTFDECRAHEMAINVAGPDAWELVDRHFSVFAAHPADELGSEA